MTIVADSDSLIGMLYPNDAHHHRALTALNWLIRNEAKIVHPATVIPEATTTLAGRLAQPEIARQITQLLVSDKLFIEPVDDGVLKEAATLLKSGSSKHHTLFDAIVAAIARRLNADAVFSFDGWYPELGLKLVSDLL